MIDIQGMVEYDLKVFEETVADKTATADTAKIFLERRALFAIAERLERIADALKDINKGGNINVELRATQNLKPHEE